MCTSIVCNINDKTLVGFNLDILEMEYQIIEDDHKVAIAIYDEKEGWLPLFGVNHRGDFVGMPTCWPYDNRSDGDGLNIVNLDIDLLLEKHCFSETKMLVENNKICSVNGVTFMSQLSNKNGDVINVIPGQGYLYKSKPKFSILTNFSPFKADSEMHPWMGLDRYNIAYNKIKSLNDISVDIMFDLLASCSQTVCPTVVSIVYDANNNIVYWCENKEYNNIKSRTF